MSGMSQFEALEAHFGILRDAFGALVVARHQGADVAGQERSYGKHRIAFGAHLAAQDGAAPTERPLLDSIVSALTWMDEMEPVDGLLETGTVAAEKPDVAELGRVLSCPPYRAFPFGDTTLRFLPAWVERDVWRGRRGQNHHEGPPVAGTTQCRDCCGLRREPAKQDRALQINHCLDELRNCRVSSTSKVRRLTDIAQAEEFQSPVHRTLDERRDRA